MPFSKNYLEILLSCKYLKYIYIIVVYIILSNQFLLTNINNDLSLKISWRFDIIITSMMLIYDFEKKVLILGFDFKTYFNIVLKANFN